MLELSRQKFGGLRDMCGRHVNTFDLEHVKAILWLFGALFSKLGCLGLTDMTYDNL